MNSELAMLQSRMYAENNAGSRTMFDQAAGASVKGRHDSEALETVARDFEALMVEQMMKSMRSASKVLNEEGLFSSREQETWQEWQDSQFAIEMSQGRGLGIARQIIEQVQSLEKS